MILAVEDVLSEVVIRRLLSTFALGIAPSVVIGLKGNSYLKAKAKDLNRTAASVPVMMLTDLDESYPCPSALIRDWIGDGPCHMTLRVAVHEVESWLIADREHFAAMLAVPAHRLPQLSDRVTNPKQYIVNLARRSRRSAVREEFVPAAGSTASVGPGFTPSLTAFASTQWSPNHAAMQSDSLRRAIARIRTI